MKKWPSILLKIWPTAVCFIKRKNMNTVILIAGVARLHLYILPGIPGILRCLNCEINWSKEMRELIGNRSISKREDSASGCVRSKTGPYPASVIGARRCPSGIAKNAERKVIGSVEEKNKT